MPIQIIAESDNEHEVYNTNINGNIINGIENNQNSNLQYEIAEPTSHVPSQIQPLVYNNNKVDN